VSENGIDKAANSAEAFLAVQEMGGGENHPPNGTPWLDSNDLKEAIFGTGEWHGPLKKDASARARRRRSPRPVRDGKYIVGFTGHQPRNYVENVFGVGHSKAITMADSDRELLGPNHCHHGDSGDIARSTKCQIPGYTGFVPNKRESHGFGHCSANEDAAAGIHTGPRPGVFRSSPRTTMLQTEGALLIPSSPMRSKRSLMVSPSSMRNSQEGAVTDSRKPTNGYADSQVPTCRSSVALPGYTGFIPAKHGEHVYGQTFRNANVQAMYEFADLRSSRPRSADSRREVVIDVNAATQRSAAGQSQGAKRNELPSRGGGWKLDWRTKDTARPTFAI
jgi:hypothetical protein